MHCFNTNNFRSLGPWCSSYKTTQQKNYKLKYNRDVTPQSLISLFGSDFCLLMRERQKGWFSLSFVLSSHFKLKGRDKMKDVRTCSPAKCAHPIFRSESLHLKAKVDVNKTPHSIKTSESYNGAAQMFFCPFSEFFVNHFRLLVP